LDGDKNCAIILVRKPQEKRPLGRPKLRKEDGWTDCTGKYGVRVRIGWNLGSYLVLSLGISDVERITEL
jgi:hypothetical protein